ncbi:MAG: SsrA-binding protein SmpB [Candidatus Ratteibacteria bacterium]|nr:SsrA-binding protein SmpB [Candidatus Ratteibacteria bacterium]
MAGKVIQNKRAFHEYHISEKFEAGIALKGTEVKSLREGNASMVDSFAKVEGGEVFLYNMHITPYEEGSIFNTSPTRKRKLLLNKHEIRKLAGKSALKGLTIVPLKVYFSSRGWAKVELGIAKPKKLFDKRAELKKRDVEKEIRKAVKNR